MRRILPLLIALLWAVPADAAPITKKKSIWGPVTVAGQSQFPIYADLGVGIFQYTVRWDQVAPTRPADPSNPADPAYRWPAEVDQAIAEGRRYGITVSLMLIGAPEWANGGRDSRWAPTNPADFATFARAASRRWPAVRHWMVWGEPTKASNFQPLAPDRGGRLRTRAQREGPRRYAQILDAAYAALKRQSARNLVIGGNTYTVGTVAPLHFLQALKLPNGRRPRMDLWGHNPFTARKPNPRAPTLGNGASDFNDLDNLAKRLDGAYRGARPRAMRRLRIFISEVTLPTDHENHEFNLYMTQAAQAQWMRQMLRITRRSKRIYTFGYLGLYDDPERPDGLQVERGLITREGVRKPSYAAFRSG